MPNMTATQLAKVGDVRSFRSLFVFLLPLFRGTFKVLLRLGRLLPIFEHLDHLPVHFECACENLLCLSFSKLRLNRIVSKVFTILKIFVLELN